MTLNRARLLIGDSLWSPQTGLLRPAGGAAAVLDEDGEAIETGPAASLIAKYPALPQDRGEGLLIPGLVDCHAHFECAVLADQVPGGVGMAGWVKRLLQVRATYTMEETEAAAREAARAMRALGTVAVGDICTILTTAPILAEADLLGVSLLEIFAANDGEAKVALRDAKARQEAAPATQAVDVRVVPHSPYGSPPATIRLLRHGGAAGSWAPPAEDQGAPPSGERPQAKGAPTDSAGADAARTGATPAGAVEETAVGVRSIHAAEHADEVDWLVSGTGGFSPLLQSRGVVPPGTTPIRYLDSLGAIGAETLLVHMVMATAEELQIASKRGATAVLCPRSNLHIGERLPDLPAIRAAGLSYVFGTDSLASSPNHDLLGEVRAIAAGYPEIPLDELLTAATTGGAAALGIRTHPWVRIDASRIPELFEEGR